MDNSNVLKRSVHGAAKRLKNLFRGMTRRETITQSKKKWNALAQKNANYYVLSNLGEGITEQEFTSAGKEDYETLVRDDEVFKRLQPFDAKRILEIGTGTGRITEFLSNAFHEVCGVDISDEMIARARERLREKSNVRLQATDGLHMPFEDAFFDAVFSFIVFQHMPDKKTVRKNIEEISRVLKKGGLAKIQLRGTPTIKGTWYYGPSFNKEDAYKLVDGLPLKILKTDGEGMKYFWIWLERV